MAETEVIEQPITNPGVETDKITHQKLLDDISEESQVVVHCSYTSRYLGDMIRIWKSTFLFPKESGRKSKLVHCENIAIYPEWKVLRPSETVNFCLIFTGLPKNCKTFDLIEQIPEPGGFEYRNIQRNETDVYYIKIN